MHRLTQREIDEALEDSVAYIRREQRLAAERQGKLMDLMGSYSRRDGLKYRL